MGWMRVLLFLAASMLSFAQGERGTFNGTVTDASGSVLPNAIVKAIQTQTNVEATATTTSAGVYRLPYLQPGTYRLTVSAAGFKTLVRDNVNLSVAQTLTIDFPMELGQVN